MGSGAGHWVDFYREVLGAQEVVGIEISEPGAAELRRLYAGTPGVTILEADVSSPGFELGRTFELASASTSSSTSSRTQAGAPPSTTWRATSSSGAASSWPSTSGS